MLLSNNSLVSRARELMEAELGDELVALDVAQGLCFGLNGPATSVWRLIEQPRSVAELKSALQAEYEVDDQELADDLAGLIGDMQSRGLVSVR